MKVLIAPDSFKGSMSANTVIDIIGKVALEFGMELNGIPLADGGEGSLSSLESVKDLVRRHLVVKDAYLNDKETYYLLSSDQKTAYIEVALICGIEDFEVSELDVLKSSSYGLGQAIQDACSKGVDDIYVFLGGSATNDGGMGLLNALGYEFYDKSSKKLKPISRNLELVESVSIPRKLIRPNIIVINDVDNPLYGPEGATYIYGTQKGGETMELDMLEKGMIQYACILNQITGKSYHDMEGSGAAGGLGYALKTALAASFTSGSDFFSEALELSAAIKKSDLVITGEGKVDAQTFFGKVISKVLSLSEKEAKDVLIIAGIIDFEDDKLKEEHVETLQLHDEGNEISYSILNSKAILEAKIRRYFIDKYKK